MEINYVCSLGTVCQSSQILKNNNFKKYSYPFDWIYSNCNNIIHCLEDNFNIFLDKSYYIDISLTTCGHSFYNKRMFNHHNPLTNKDNYNYYVRCVERFRQLLKQEEYKLFIMIFINLDDIIEKDKNEIIDFNNKFLKYTKNYKLLIIYHIKNKQNNHHIIIRNNNNIDFLELHTISRSNGLKFEDDNDNNYLNNIINKMYNFNIKK